MTLHVERPLIKPQAQPLLVSESWLRSFPSDVFVAPRSTYLLPGTLFGTVLCPSCQDPGVVVSSSVLFSVLHFFHRRSIDCTPAPAISASPRRHDRPNKLFIVVDSSASLRPTSLSTPHRNNKLASSLFVSSPDLLLGLRYVSRIHSWYHSGSRRHQSSNERHISTVARLFPSLLATTELRHLSKLATSLLVVRDIASVRSKRSLQLPIRHTGTNQARRYLPAVLA